LSCLRTEEGASHSLVDEASMRRGSAKYRIMESIRVDDMKRGWRWRSSSRNWPAATELASTLNGLARGTISEAPFEELSATFSVPIVSADHPAPTLFTVL